MRSKRKDEVSLRLFGHSSLLADSGWMVVAQELSSQSCAQQLPCSSSTAHAAAGICKEHPSCLGPPIERVMSTRSNTLPTCSQPASASSAVGLPAVPDDGHATRRTSHATSNGIKRETARMNKLHAYYATRCCGRCHQTFARH